MARIKGRLNKALGPKPGGRVVSTRTRKPKTEKVDTEGLTEQINQEVEGFNRGSKKRFKNVRKSAKKTIKRALKDQKRAIKFARKSGRQEKADIRATGQKNIASSAQSLASRGLGNTTIVDSAARGIRADTQKDISRVNESVRGRVSSLHSQRAALRFGLGQFDVDTQLSRNDRAPNVSQMIKLLKQSSGGV